MQDAPVFIAGLLIVALLTWLVARKVHTTLAAARTRETEVRLEEARATLERERQSFEADRARDAERFKALSADALKTNSEEFLKLATTKLETATKQAEAELTLKQEAIQAQLKPVGDALTKYQEGLALMEKTQAQARADLTRQLETLGQSQASLQRETTTLANALRNPTVRGRWGELSLQRVVELAGITEHCIETQSSVDGDDGRLRPDMIVQLPGRRSIVIDAKAPLDAYLEAVGATNDEARGEALAKHAKQLRGHALALGDKAYWEHFNTPDFVVMFVPGDSILGAALDADPDLLDETIGRNVVLATPSTLVSLLKTIELGWRQEKIAKNAEAVADLGAQLHERLGNLTGHFDKMGKALGGAVEAYNKAMGSYETRVLVPARKLREMGSAGGTELETPVMVEKAARPVVVIDAEEA